MGLKPHLHVCTHSIELFPNQHIAPDTDLLIRYLKAYHTCMHECCLLHWAIYRGSSSIDGFQMSIKRPTSGGQACDQEAAV